MSDRPSCTLSITSARPDTAFLEPVVRHIVAACDYPFIERILVMDTAPLAARYLSNPDLANEEEFHAVGERLIADGVIDRIDFPDYSPAARKRIYSKHLGRDHWETHDFRGTQVLGTMQQIEDAQGDFFLHFDSDVLLYQAPGYNWIDEAMQLLREVPEVMVALPLPGPPRHDGGLHQPFSPYTHDPRGFYCFKWISSRRFLIDRRKYDKILPFKARFASWKRKLLSNFTRKSTLLNWEQMASAAIDGTDYIRADSDSPEAWTLHADDHGKEFCRILPQIIERVERGWFPEEQRGHYDVQMDAWIKALELEIATVSAKRAATAAS